MMTILKFLNLITLLITVQVLSAQQTVATKRNDASSIYNIQDSVMITTADGAKISAIVVRKKGDTNPKPVIFQYTIYVRDNGRDLKTLKEAADHDYVGVIAYTRGKRFSQGEILPYENEGSDARDVIAWISKQNWCNGSVGMFGGSYNGFTQWAAAKKLHPALKTIVPYVANRPGMGLPMENNIFVNPNYEWAFYVGSNKYLDTVAGNDRQRFRNMQGKWWDSGSAYKKLDSIDGTPNRLFQRWIGHPAFDPYWQNMAPFREDFAQINIPVLAFDGYYNDSQNSSLYYLREMQKYNPKTPHYLIIGPYGHFGTQIGGQPIINQYQVDASALIDIKKITYQWFDYILKGGIKPAVLKDHINYEVMGANEWRSAPSLDKMSNGTLKLYLTTEKSGDFYALSNVKPNKHRYLKQVIDFSDRKVVNNDYYPDPIIRKELDRNNGFFFVSEPLKEPVIVNGSFIGQIRTSINKKDLDIGITLYEVMTNGEYFHLSYYIGRASYANDITKRTLLKPHKIETIPFNNTHLVSKQLRKGSRILVVINVNKNQFSQLNYGTGKNVNDETVKDAGIPLEVKWYNDSFIEIPILK